MVALTRENFLFEMWETGNTQKVRRTRETNLCCWNTRIRERRGCDSQLFGRATATASGVNRPTDDNPSRHRRESWCGSGWRSLRKKKKQIRKADKIIGLREGKVTFLSGLLVDTADLKVTGEYEFKPSRSEEEKMRKSRVYIKKKKRGVKYPLLSSRSKLKYGSGLKVASHSPIRRWRTLLATPEARKKHLGKERSSRMSPLLLCGGAERG